MTCAVTGPDGSDVPVVAVDTADSIELNGLRYERVAELTAPTDGDYRFECLGPPATMLYAHPSSLGLAVMIPIIVAVGISLLFGILGLVLAIIGIVRVVRVNRERRAFDVSSTGYGGTGPAWGGVPPPSGGAPR